MALLAAEGAALLVLLWGLIASPLSFDEQWRAYYVSLGTGLWDQLDTSSAPFTAGWVGLEQAAAALAGTTEWGLRLPMALAVPATALATYWLGRRWLGPPAAFLPAAAVAVNGSVLVYGLLVKPFVFDGLWTVMALLVWLWLDEEGRRWPGRALGHLALGLVTVAAVASGLVVAPLLLLGLVRAAHGGWRRLLGQLALSALTAAVALAHLLVFIVPQTRVLAAPYWVGHFAPVDEGGAAVLRFVWQQLAGYLPELATSTYLAPDLDDPLWRQATKVPPPPGLGLLVSVALLVALAAGVASCWRRRDGQALLVAVGGALAGQLAGAMLHVWPFGLVRANLFLLPLLYLLVAVGAARLGAVALARRPPMPRWAALAPVLLVAAAVVLAGGFAARNLGSLYRHWDAPGLATGVRAAVAEVRGHAGAGDLVIVTGNQRGWSWYMERYQGFPAPVGQAPPVSAERTLHSALFRPDQLQPFLAAHPRAASLFVFEFVYDTKPRTLRLVGARRSRLAAQGWCPRRRWEYPLTGVVTQYRHTGGCALAV